MHLACLPFPSAQGTQAAIASLLQALEEQGEDATLMSYPFGDERLSSAIKPIRPPLFTLARSLRSGPSLAKLFLDMQLVAALRGPLRGAGGKEPLIAHHVEAAWAARLAGRDYHYIAHTSVEDELEAYFPRVRDPRVFRAIGALLDRFAIEGAIRCAAVSPALSSRLAARSGRAFSYLPIPWSLPTLMPRELARRALGISPSARVILYTGNLDAYQRWELGFELAERLQQLGREAIYLIGTESEPSIVHRHARAINYRAGYQILGCALEEDRARLHAAADLALIPRKLDGGVPIKLLEALARDRPALVSEEASAGLALSGEASIVSSGRVEDYLEAALEILERMSDQGSGREFIARAHSKDAAVKAFRELIGLEPATPSIQRQTPELVNRERESIS